MKLKILRLLTGEEILGNILEESDTHYTVENPCSIGLSMGQNGKPALNMQPMLMLTDQKQVSIKKDHVTFDVSVATEIENKYNEFFGSGIVVAKKSIIT